MFPSRMVTAAILAALSVMNLSDAQADLRFKDAEVDLGEVRAGRRLTPELALVNDGDEDVAILEAGASCGCLAPRVEPRVLAPRGNGRLHLQVNTLGQGAGTHFWKAWIRYRQGNIVTEAEVRLRARIVTEITVQPASLTLVSEGGLTQQIVVTDHRAQPMKITQVSTSAPFLKSWLLEQGKDSQGRWAAKIHLEVTRDVPAGRHAEALAIYADDPLYGEMRVPVTVVKVPAKKVTISPPLVRFASSKVISSRMVRIHGADGQAIQVEKTEADHPGVSCKWASDPEGDVFLKIQVDPVRLPEGLEKSIVHVHLTAPTREVLTIPVLIGDDR